MYYADRLMELPAGVLGVALGTILLPALSKTHASADRQEYSRLLDWGLRLSFLLALPSAVALAVLAEPLTVSLFQYGKFAAHDALMTQRALIASSLGLLGIHAFSQQNFEEAIRYWERIVSVAPNHPQITSIRQGIEQAYQRLGREMPQEQPSEVSGAGVTVQVEIDEAFQGEIPDDTTLFVLARRANVQGGPPLAVARLSAGQLPMEIRLDDRFNMSANAKLSEAGEVRLQARLSRSGNARPQAGDWQGEVDQPVPVGEGENEPVTLVIDTQLVQ